VKNANKTPLDFIPQREELVPVQVRLPQSLLAEVKAKLDKSGLTFTDLVRGACSWYLESADTSPDPLLTKRKSR
jgi:predicted DNA binding CopG/RHH family protein